MIGVGGGLVALQSLSIIGRGTGPFKRMIGFEISTTAKGRLKIKVTCFSGKCKVWGVIHSPITLNLEKNTRTPDY